ncbi:MAG: chalcone isomerase family protein [Pseudomonadota bacterium]
MLQVKPSIYPSRHIFFVITIAFFCSFPYAIMATNQSSIDNNKEQSMQLVGKSKLKFWGFSIYTAELFSPNGKFDAIQPGLKLQLTYHRDIKKNALIKRTLKEWERLPNYDKQKVQMWADKLDAIWPDIKKNDTLAAYLNKDGITEFFYQSRPIGAIADKEFGVAFLSIWLAKTTSEPQMREEIISSQNP